MASLWLCDFSALWTGEGERCRERRS